MRYIAKISMLTLLMVMILLAALADVSFFKQWLQGHLDVALYLRLVAILGLLIVFPLAWAYKLKVQASHKYRRADEVLARATAKAENEQRAAEKLRQRLEAEFSNKEKTLNEELEEIKQTYHQKINDLKAKNVQLKEAVASLMHAVKTRRADAEVDPDSAAGKNNPSHDVGQ
ncbi:MAG: hypothetical protein HKP58_14870 [Desulfatitalea sp.]|nr:hypothetical protein [Desulfatitalea sp.]NNK01690.1 hypothetical protein [Desulfatitalea sp.]